MEQKFDILPPEHVEALRQIEAFCQDNKIISLKISNDIEMQNAGALGKELKFYERSIEDKRKIAKAPALELCNNIDAPYIKVRTLVSEKIGFVASAIRTYQAEQEKIRLEAIRKAEEAAMRERAKIEEAARVQREKENKLLEEAEAKRKLAETADAETRLKLEAEVRKAERNAEIAAEKAYIKEAAIETVLPVFVAPVASVKGVSERANWKFKTVDFVAYLEYCIQTKQYELLDVHQVNTSSLVKRVKDSRKIPGLEIYNDISTVFRK